MLCLSNRSSLLGLDAGRDLYLFLCVSLVFIFWCSEPVKAGVIVDTYDVGGGLQGAEYYGAVFLEEDFMSPGFSSALRLAAKFNVTGSDYHLSSIKLPIGFNGTEADNYLKVSVARDSLGIPGDILEILSNGQNIWPASTNPFSASTELISVSNPLLSSGQSYWIIAEPTSLLTTPMSYVDYLWFTTAAGPYSIAIQEQTFGGLPSNWSAGNFSSGRLAFRVEGTAVPEPASIAVLGIGAIGLLMKRMRSKNKQKDLLLN